MKNDILHFEILEQIDAQENVDYALGGIPTGWLKPAFITTEQIDAQENVGMVPNSPNEPMIILDPAGFTTPFGLGWVDPSWTIDPVTGSYIDDPISGMIDSIGEKPSLYIDPNFDKNDLLHIEIEGFTNDPMIILEPEGFTNEPMIILEPEGFTTPFGLGWVDPSWTIDPVTGSYIDDPISGMIDSIGEKPSLTMGRIPVSWWRNIDTTTDLPVSMNMASNNSPTAGNDTLTGTASNDRLSGLAGNDTLDGALGNDVLNGGVGNDVLIGGAGKDKLTGGKGADTFKFASSNESTFWSMDTITDFKHAQGDKIDLSAIDSNANVAGDQGFTLVSAFSADATGQLYFDAKTDILFGSTDADSAPEFAITLNGVNTLLPADFIF